MTDKTDLAIFLAALAAVTVFWLASIALLSVNSWASGLFMTVVLVSGLLWCCWPEGEGT